MSRDTISYEYQENELTPAEEQLQIDRRHAKRMRKKRRRRRMGIYLLLLILVCAGLFAFARSSFFDISDISVELNEYYTDEQIVDMCKAKTGENLFSVKKGKMRKALEKDPYIESARIKRKLPSTLVIEVNERKELVAVWSDKKYYIIDASGLVLSVTEEKPSITRLLGYKVLKGEVDQPIEIKENSSFTKTINMLETASGSTITFRRVKEKDNILKAYVYKNLYVRGTAKNIQECIESGTLEAVLYDLTEKDIKNGMVRVGDEDYCVFSPEN